MELLTASIVLLITLGFTYITHEFGHYIYDLKFSKCKPKIIFQRKGFRTGLAVRAEIPENLFPIIRQNPSKFVINRNFSRAVGVIGVIPLFIAKLSFSELKWIIDPIIFLFLIYSLWETASLDHNYLNKIFSNN